MSYYHLSAPGLAMPGFISGLPGEKTLPRYFFRENTRAAVSNLQNCTLLLHKYILTDKPHILHRIIDLHISRFYINRYDDNGLPKVK